MTRDEALQRLKNKALAYFNDPGWSKDDPEGFSQAADLVTKSETAGQLGNLSDYMEC